MAQGASAEDLEKLKELMTGFFSNPRQSFSLKPKGSLRRFFESLRDRSLSIYSGSQAIDVLFTGEFIVQHDPHRDLLVVAYPSLSDAQKKELVRVFIACARKTQNELEDAEREFPDQFKNDSG